MAKMCILLLTLVPSAWAQTSSDLSAKYPQVSAYWVRPDVLMTAKFAADGEVCEMTLLKPEKTDSGIVSGLSFSKKEVQSLIDDLVPQNQRGRNLTRLLNETIDGSFSTVNYTYENLVVHVYGTLRPEETAGYRVINMTWPKRSCSGSQNPGVAPSR